MASPTFKPSAKRSVLSFYSHVTGFGLLIFVLLYGYLTLTNVPGSLNKAVADTSIILIGLSMALSGLSYFFNLFDSKVIYRKYLGLIGFAFGVLHIILSFSSLQRLFDPAVWQRGAMWPMLTGFLAALILAVMTMISNRMTMTTLGVQLWRSILRLGYLAMLFVGAHVIILKSARWIAWFENGMQSAPSVSLLVTVFIGLVLFLRLALWAKLKMASRAKKTSIR